MKGDIKMSKKFNQLGLPPMALAETKECKRVRRAILIYTIVRKICMGLIFISIFTGAFIFLTKLIENMDGFPTTQIFFVTGVPKSSNAAPHQDIPAMYFKTKNESTSAITKRKKRHVLEGTDIEQSISKFTNEDYQKARDIILNHKVLCNSESKHEVCEDLIMKLKTITEHESKPGVEDQKTVDGLATLTKIGDKSSKKGDKAGFTPNYTSKRETRVPEELTGVVNRNAYGYGDESYSNHYPNYVVPHPHQLPLPHLTDTCLLARLLKKGFPHHQGSYDVPKPEYVPNQSYYSQPLPALSNKYRASVVEDQDSEPRKHVIHPQDVEIFKKYLTPTPEITRPPANITSARDAQCPPGTISCRNGDGCIMESQWCNGHVECSDVSDEAKCSCKSRVDKSRLCDGYFDCPFGEDEMGCYGCSENAFSCEDLDINSKTTCFLKEHRCNNIMDCPNNKDEMDCNMLSPSLHNKPLFAVSNTEGFLQRNFKGDWYAVCENPYMWAHDACRRETGLIIRPPYIQIVPVDPLLRVSYLNTSPEGLVHTSDTCFNSSAIYVTCPELLCGTRMLTSSQIIKENSAAENHLFGRNKRFLLRGIPYPKTFDRPLKRFARDTRGVRNPNKNGKVRAVKSKRAQSRVVGGKPSKPAAWPWVTAMYRDGMFHCGGVIITQYWVLSAAHCVHEFWKHYYEVQVGMLRRFSFSPQEQNHVISHIIVNHHYDEADMRNDVSLLKVKTAIRFSRWVRPICLPGPNTAGPEWRWGPPPGTSCTAVGWGATVEHGPDPDHMRDVELPIWANCKHPEDRVGNEICAGPIEGGKDACQGDSGGPLLCRSPLNSQQWYLAGIVSHGDGCARKGEPGVYTRVSLFVKWIKYHIGSNMLPTIQPIQKCPGFKCTSGISKCLPEKRVCDKIIDCLNAEDEKNCTSERSFENLFLSRSSKDNHGNLVNDLTSMASELNVLRESVTEDSVNKHTDKNINIHGDSFTKRDDQMSKDKETTTSDTSNDFQHASTIELSISKSSEDSGQATVDPTSLSRESDFFDNTFMMTSPRSALESRSSLLETDKILNNIHFREADIQEDLSVLNTDSSETTTITNVKTNSPTSETTQMTEQFTTISVESATESAIGMVDTNDKSDINESNEAESKALHVELLPELQNLDEKSKNEPDLNDNNNGGSAESKGLFTHISQENHDFSKEKIHTFEDKQDIIHEIEEIVLSDLQPAKIRKKHRTPKEFVCRRITQAIPYSHRCDHKPDCEDGTDELSCTCIDYLYAFQKSLLCDGIFDCADGQDEADCFSCPEDRFLCRRSQICLPMKNVCDGKPHCPQGEDEVDCFALSNGKELNYNIDERPKINLEGYLTKKQKNKWHIVCEDNLSTEQQEQAADHICHYLGFSSANSYLLKHINVKDEILKTKMDEDRKRREARTSVPVHFTYRDSSGTDDVARHIVIKEPQVLKEQCVPNVKKTCMSLYVYCDGSLYDYGLAQNYLYGRSAETDITEQMWPWVAKVFVEGHYKCTGVLVDLSLVLVSHSCLWDSTLNYDHISVVLGSYRTLNYTSGPYEQILKVDAKRDIFRNNIALLHLMYPAQYSTMVRPMIIHSSSIPDENNSTCVAVGQDDNNQTMSVTVQETRENCHLHNKCYKINSKSNSLCSSGKMSSQQWAGVISCHTERGWYPTATFVDIRGECGIQNHIQGTAIDDLKAQIRDYLREGVSENMKHGDEKCFGVRCGRGKCINMRNVCNGVRSCEDGKDESEEACEKKHQFCERDPHSKECECSIDQFRCHNGRCIPKEQFNDGHDHCGDRTDEPEHSNCAKYLARVNPSGLCDGILHCKDRSDEDPMFCKCFARRTYPCGKTTNVDYCVAPDVVCDGVPDCPNGEDEQTCIGLNAPEGTPYGRGQVIVRSHGVWHAKCYANKKRTKFELEAICRELGFISGHAKELDASEDYKPHPYNNVLLDPFSEVLLNNQTQIRIRNSHTPLARAIFDDTLNNCNPVFIECL